jgi:hypothetical protein
METLTFLLSLYWPYMGLALLAGVVAGWFSLTPRKE